MERRDIMQKAVAMGDFGNAAILIHLFTRWHNQEGLEDIEIWILQNNMNIQK